MPPEDQMIAMRLRSAEGHLRSVIRMVEGGENRQQALHQLAAVQAALRVAGCALLREQVQDSLALIQRNPSEEVRQLELKKLCSLYQLWVKFHLSFKETTKELT